MTSALVYRVHRQMHSQPAQRFRSTREGCTRFQLAATSRWRRIRRLRTVHSSTIQRTTKSRVAPGGGDLEIESIDLGVFSLGLLSGAETICRCGVPTVS